MARHPYNAEIKSAVILGAGNLAWHLGHCLLQNGINIRQIFNRSVKRGIHLAESLKTSFTDQPENVDADADLYIIAVSDDAIQNISRSVKFNRNAVVVHTAGSLDMNVLEGSSDRLGVLYPLQTFTKERPVDFKEIPMLIEASDSVTLSTLRNLSLTISNTVMQVNSADRLVLHLCAVISSNFSNHLLALSEKILAEKKLPPELLKPLMSETIAKAFSMSPLKAQTGPAVRKNEKVMKKHLEMLKRYPEIQLIYRIMSESIINISAH